MKKDSPPEYAGRKTKPGGSNLPLQDVQSRPPFESLFQLSKHDRTRDHTLKLSKHCTRRDVRLYFFSERVISNWNNLDQSVIEAGCVNTFKRRLHDHRNDKMDLFIIHGLISAWS